MPKILQISVEVNKGSTGFIAESIGKIAMNHGWESYIAYGRFSNPSQSKLIKISTPLGVLFHGLQSVLFDRHGLGSYYETLQFVKKIKMLQPDVIHLHNIHGYYLNIEVLFSFLAESQIPVVWTLHDCWPVTGHCSHFDFVGCDKWKTNCIKCPQIKQYPASLFVDRSDKNFRLKKEIFQSVKNLTLVSVSQWLNKVLDMSFLSGINRTVIFNGVDIEMFSPQDIQFDVKKKHNIVGKHVILGVATTWTHRKGLQDFIALSKLIEPDSVVVLVGLTDSQIRNLPNNVIGVNRTEDQNELRDYYTTANVLLSLSVEESFGLTIVEAFACGTPAIVYNCTAQTELIDNNTGLIVEKGNIEGVSIAIKKIRDIGKDKYTKNCRSKAIQFYNQRKNFEEYFKLYETLVFNKFV